MNLLHIDSSIQGANSASRAMSAALVDRLRSADPGLQTVYRDLAAAPLSHFGAGTLESDDGKAILAEFQAADIVVIGAALYNFTIPSQLKAWIDRILVAGQTFRYGESGPVGLAGDKRVVVTLARGSVYSAGSPFAPFEHGESLLRSVLAFIGVTDPEFIIAEGLALGAEARQAALDIALEQVAHAPLAA